MMNRITHIGDGQTEIYYADGVKPIRLDGDFDIEIWGQSPFAKFPECKKCSLWTDGKKCRMDWKITETAPDEYKCFFYDYEFIKEEEYGTYW